MITKIRKIIFALKKSFSWIIFISCMILVAVQAVFCFETDSTTILEDEREANTPYRPLLLAIPNFRKEIGDTRYEALRRSFPEVLAIGTINIKHVLYVGHDQFWRLSNTFYSPKDLRLNPDIIFSEEMLNLLNIDLVLRGSFSEFKDKLQAKAYLEDRREKTSTEISSNIFESKNLLIGINSLVYKFIGELNALKWRQEAKRVAVLCFDEDSNSAYSSNDTLSKDLTISLIANLNLKKNLVVLPWSVTQPVCESDHLEVQSLSARLNADALVTGSISRSKSILTIVPKLYIKGENNYIELNPVVGDLNNYFSLESNLIQELRSILESMAISNGGWDMSVVFLVSEKKNEYIDEGKVLVKNPKKQALASLMFKRALDIEPTDFEAQYYLGLTKLNRKRYSEAIRDFQLSLEINSKFVPTHVKLGDTYFEMGKYKEALTFYQKAQDLDKNNFPELHAKIGTVGYLIEEYYLAIQELKVAIDIQPGDKEIWLRLAQSYLAVNQNTKAIEIYRNISKQYPDNKNLHDRLRNICLEEGRKNLIRQQYKLSLDYFDVASAIRADSELIALQIDVNTRLQQYDEAQRTFFFAETEGLVNAEIYHNYGWSLFFNKDYLNALKNMDKAIQLNSKEANYYNSRGWINDKLNRIPEAISDYTKAIRIDPNIKQAYNNLAYDLNEQGRYSEALEKADQAIKISPNYANLYNQKGFSLYKLGHLEEGLENITRALQIRPSYGGAYFNRAIIYAEQGDLEKALFNLARAIEINNNYKLKASQQPAFLIFAENQRLKKLITH